MANPQLEDGFVRIANEIIEAIARGRFTGYQYAILLWVLRQTFGWGRKNTEYTAYGIAKHLGLDRKGIRRALKALTGRNVLIASGKALSFHKDHAQWGSTDPLGLQTHGSTDPQNRGLQTPIPSIGKKERKSSDQWGSTDPYPTLEEVRAYCQARGRGVNPEQWMDHYQSNGWMVGKVKMRDWQAAVRTWERNHFRLAKEAPANDTSHIYVQTKQDRHHA